jgi:hypothetical protein
LRAVTDPKRRDALREDLRVHARRALGVHRRRATGEQDRARVAPTDLVDRDAVRDEL